jgi:hypothetical protein
VLDRYLGNQAVRVVTPAPAATDAGFQLDWANIGIGVGAVLVAALVVASAVAVVRHGGHGGPGRPVPHG